MKSVCIRMINFYFVIFVNERKTFCFSIFILYGKDDPKSILDWNINKFVDKAIYIINSYFHRAIAEFNRCHRGKVSAADLSNLVQAFKEGLFYLQKGKFDSLENLA